MSGDHPSPLHAPVLWAQRSDCLYVTISLGDVKDKVLELKDDSLHFRGKSGVPKPVDYEANIQFYGQVDPQQSRQMSTDREIVMYIKKKEDGFWPRLISSSVKQPWLRVDFNRWVDENDSESEMEGMGKFDSMLSQMSNFNDFGDDGDGDVDSDDEELPDLEMSAKTGCEKVLADLEDEPDKEVTAS